MAYSGEEIRTEILRRLRARPGPNVNWTTESFEDLAPEEWRDGQNVRPGTLLVYAVFWRLVQQGIIIPGHQQHGRFSQSNAGFRNFPFFSITPYGHQVLENLTSDTDPADAADYLAKLKSRAPLANETVLRYVGESVSTFNMQNYLASAVLLGVAAETLLEQLYFAIGKHLNADEAPYTSKLEVKRWASQRLEYARSRLATHLTEFPTEFQTRVDQYLDMLAQILKISRDDVGHSRPLRIDREIASMNLASFPVLAGIIDELITHLSSPCSSP
jgi:hypothetical protein